MNLAPPPIRTSFPAQSEYPGEGADYLRYFPGEVLLVVLNNSFKPPKIGSSSIVAGIIIFIGGSFLLSILFCFLRPKYQHLYSPRLQYVNQAGPNPYIPPGTTAPPPVKTSMFNWIYVVWHISDEELVQINGIDSALFIIFHKMLFRMFLVLSFVLCIIGLPINTYYNLSAPSAKLYTSADSFIALTPLSVEGPAIAAHVVMGYILTVTVLSFLWYTYKKMIKIRRQKFMTIRYQRLLSNRTLLVTGIPSQNLSAPGLANLINSTSHLSQSSIRIERIDVGRDTKQLTALCKKHYSIVQLLENTLYKYFKNSRLPAKRPQRKPLKEDRSIVSKKVDAINYLVVKIKKMKEEIQHTKMDLPSNIELPYGFITYRNQVEAHWAAKTIEQNKKRLLGAHVRLAPKPEDIIWKNLVLGKYQRGLKQIWGWAFFVSIALLWITPNAFMSCFLSDLSRLGILWPPFAVYLHYHPTVFAVVQGIASPLLTAIIFWLISVLIRRVAQWQGELTKNERERDVSRKLYIFFIFNNLIVFSLLGVAWSSIMSFVDKNAKNFQDLHLAEAVGTAIISTSSFWVMYLLQANLMAIFTLLMASPILRRISRNPFSRLTPREKMLLTSPQRFNFATYYVWLLFYSTIALAFTSVQPIIYPVLTFYMLFDVLIKKYALTYMFVTKAESDGMMWPFLFNCIIFATVLGNGILFLIVWIKSSVWIAMSVIPLPIVVIGFKIVTRRKLAPKFYYFFPTKKENEIMMNAMYVARGQIIPYEAEDSYRNPILYERLPVPMVPASSAHKLSALCTVDDMFNGDSPINEFDIIRDDELDFYHYVQHTKGRELQSNMGGYNFNRSPPQQISIPLQSIPRRDNRAYNSYGLKSHRYSKSGDSKTQTTIFMEDLDDDYSYRGTSAGIIQELDHDNDEETGYLLRDD